MYREGMTIKMDRKELLFVVKEQLQKHTEEYEEAMKGWREKLAEECRRVHDDLVTPSTSKKVTKFPHELSKLHCCPEEHKDDFETTISMLESAQDELIELDQTTYERIVMGKFQWREAFTNTNAMYRNGR